MLFILFVVAEFLIYKTNVCPFNTMMAEFLICKTNVCPFNTMIAEFLICKTNVCPSNTMIVSWLLLHVLSELCPLQGVCTPMFTTLMSIIHYNSNAYYIVMISTAELKNVRSHKMQLKCYAWCIIVGVTIVYKHLIYSRSCPCIMCQCALCRR